VDTPNKQQLIAANSSIEEIRRFVEADSLGYLSLGGLSEAVDDHDRNYCYACYTGNYPTDLIQIDDLMRGNPS
jgi:amidophosphoribosyltransferase